MLFNDMEAANVTVVTTEVFQNDEKPTRQLERIQVHIYLEGPLKAIDIPGFLLLLLVSIWPIKFA